MLEKILLAVAAVVVVLVIVVALQPAEYRVARSTAIAVPPAAVFAHVNDLHDFQVWNPFAKLDPAARNTFEGPPAGTGAAMAWSGNSQIGAGRMTITESRPSELVRMRLDFLKPFAATAVAEFTFVPEGGRTVVTWSMTGRRNFVAKAMGLVMSMDSMVGGRFDTGLAALKSLSEVTGAARP